MLEIRRLEVVGIPDPAPLSLSVGAGEVMALAGPSGSGKSLLLRTVAGLESPRAGSIRWAGSRIDRLGPAEVARRGVRLVPASGSVLAGLSVAENLRLGAMRFRRGAWRKELEWVTGLFPGLEARLDEPAGRLGAAEQRVLAMGRALLGRPRLLLIDGVRPGGLPASIGGQLLEVISALAAKGLAVVVAERQAAAVPVANLRFELSGRRQRVPAMASRVGSAPEAGLDEIYLGEPPRGPGEPASRGLDQRHLGYWRFSSGEVSG